MAHGGSAANPVEEHLKFVINGSITVTVVSGDITQMQADGVVVGETSSFGGWGMAASAIDIAGGYDYRSAKKNMAATVSHADRTSNRVKPVYWCSAGSKLKYKRVYHAIFPATSGKGVKPWQADVAAVYTRVCADADTKNFDASLVVPILGSGGTGVGTFEDAAWAALNGIRAYNALSLKDVTLVEKDSWKAKKIVEVCKNWMDWQGKKYNNTQVRIIPPSPASGGLQGSSGTEHTPQNQARFSRPSGGLLGSALVHGQSGLQSNTGSSTSPTRVRRRGERLGQESSGSSGHGGDCRGLSSTGRSSSPSNYGSTTTSSSCGWDRSRKQATKKDEKLGNFNHHMMSVARKTEEKRRRETERSGYEHKESMTAMLTDTHQGHNSQRHTSGRHGGLSEQHLSGRRSPFDDREVTPMEGVEEGTGPFAASTRRRTEQKLREKSESSSTPLNIVIMDEIEDKSSDDEASPHPGSDGNTPPKRREAGTPTHLSKNGSFLPPSSRADPADRGLFTGNPGRLSSAGGGYSTREQDYPSLRSTGGTAGAGFNDGDKKDYTSPISSHSSGSRMNISGRYGTAESQSSPLYSSYGKVEGSQFSSHNNGFSSLGSTSKSSTSTRLAGGGNDHSFQRSYSNEDKLHQSSSGCDVSGASATSKVSRQNSGGENGEKEMATARNRITGIDTWENIEQRTNSSPEGKMVVTQNKRIQLDGCDVLVIEYSFPTEFKDLVTLTQDSPTLAHSAAPSFPTALRGEKSWDYCGKPSNRTCSFLYGTTPDKCLVDSNSNILHLTSHRDSNVKAYLRNVKSVLKEKYRLDLE